MGSIPVGGIGNLIGMGPEEKHQFSEMYRMVKENNQMLYRIRRAARWGIIFRIFYWMVIIGLSVGTYYYIQPYLDALGGVFEELKGGLKNTLSITERISDLRSLFEKVPKQ